MDEDKIVEMYTKGGYTLRHLADEFSSNHHRIKRILVKHGVTITRRNSLKEFSTEHKRKISETRKKMFANGETTTWSKGKKMADITNRKNLIAHLKYDITIDFLEQFEDIEKIKVLNNAITRDRVSKYFNTEKYKLYLQRFYHDSHFNFVYNNWLVSGKNNYYKPSLDHIIPTSRGGSFELENLQFLSWFENRTKNDMTMDEWLEFRKTTKTTSSLFLKFETNKK